jgi:prepilin-type N-terminal cleavage/methylation domain-containing protein
MLRIRIQAGRKSMDTQDQKHGFTLIELLVVVAIIAILAAVLFPVFAQAREKARQSACLSNLKQIGEAVMMYLQDYDDTYPGGGPEEGWDFWVAGPEGSWENLPIRTGSVGGVGKVTVNMARYSITRRLLSYVKNTQVFLCPNRLAGESHHLGWDWDTRLTRLSYGWNQGVSRGVSWPTMPKNRPSLLGKALRQAEVSQPVLLPLVQDGDPSLHSGHAEWWLYPQQARWNICYADGHARFSRYVDYWEWIPVERAPWFWDTVNPRQPVDVESPCTPTCSEESARN